MTSHYEIRLYDPFGAYLAVLDGFMSLDYVLKVNEVGTVSLVVSIDYPPFLFRKDGRIEVWRGVGAGPLRLQNVWLIVKRRTAVDDDGELLIDVAGHDLKDLLRRRIVAYAASTAYADKQGLVDDLAKAIVRENLGSLATDTARSWATYLSVAPDLGLGPAVTKACSHRNVLAVLQELCEASAQLGTFLAFDVVPTGTSPPFEFRTYVHQRGVDHRYPGGASPVLLSPDRGNLTDASVTYDWSEEATYVYAGGQGEGQDRIMQTASDDTRIGASPFGRVEHFVDARNGETPAAVTSEAQAELMARRPRVAFQGTLVDTEATAYEVHYGLGDRVTAQFEGELFDCHVMTVHVSVRDGREAIRAQLRYDG